MIKLSGECMLLLPGTGLFNKKDLRKFIIPASVLQAPMVVYAVFLGVFGKFKWKDQTFERKVQ
jgi:hypothetical protein